MATNKGGKIIPTLITASVLLILQVIAIKAMLFKKFA
jgi:hypothetical protein